MGCFIFGSGGGRNNGGGPDFSLVNMEPQFALAGKKFYNRNQELKTGTILNWDGTPLTLMDGDTIPDADVVEPSLTTRYIPSGKYLGKPVELAPMAQGSIFGSLLDDHTFRIVKTAGYIEGGAIDYAIPSRVYHVGGSAEFSASSFSRINIPHGGLTLYTSALFAIYLVADNSVTSGKIAAMYLCKDYGGDWRPYGVAYKVGTGNVHPSVSYTVSPEGQYYLRIDINEKAGNANYCEFSTTVTYSAVIVYWDEIV